MRLGGGPRLRGQVSGDPQRRKFAEFAPYLAVNFRGKTTSWDYRGGAPPAPPPHPFSNMQEGARPFMKPANCTSVVHPGRDGGEADGAKNLRIAIAAHQFVGQARCKDN